MGCENAVRVRFDDAEERRIETHIIFDLDRLRWRAKLRESLNDVIALRRRHFHLGLRGKIVIQNRTVMIDHKPVDDVVTVLDCIFLSRSVGRMEVPQNAATDGEDNKNDNESLT